MKRIVFSLFIFVFLLSISYIAYAQLFSHGFVFEEWQIYAETRVLKSIIPETFFVLPISDILLAKGRILGSLCYDFLVLSFGNTAAPYAIVGIIGHAINSYLLFLIARKLFKNKIVAFLCSVFFLTIPISHEALSYFAASLQTVYSLSLYLLSFYTVLLFFETRRRLLLFISFVLLYCSILFKESSAFFVLVLVAVFVKNIIPRKNRALYVSIMFLCLMILGSLVFIVFTGYSKWYQLLFGSAGFAPITTLANVVIYPIITVSHFIIPERLFIRLGTYYVMSHYPFLGWIPTYVYSFIYSSFAVDIISLFFAIPIWIFIFYGYGNSKRKRLYLFLLSLYFLSFVPVAIVQQQRSTGFLERRYYYGINPAFILLMVSALESWYVVLAKNWHKRILRQGVTGITLICIMLLIVKNITVIHREVADQVVRSQRIRTTVSQILAAHPDIPNRPVFYIEGGQDLFSHYGTGYMLALLYAHTHKIPRSLLADVYSSLYYAKTIGKKDFEGYLTEGEKAIGFYYKKSSLLEFLAKNSIISTKQLVGFVINGSRDIEPLSEQQMVDIIQ